MEQPKQANQDYSGLSIKTAGEGVSVWEQMRRADIAAGRAVEPEGATGSDPAGMPPGGAGYSGSGFEERLRELVARFRRTDGTYPPWRVAFALARLCRGESDAPLPDEFEPVANRFFSAVGIRPEVGWGEFEKCWPLVRLPEGSGTWASAVEMAITRPLAITPPPGPHKTTIASLAAYLSEASGGKPFVFCGSKIADALNIPPATAYDHLAALVARKVIRWHDTNYNHVKGKSRVAVFIGRVVGEAPHA